MVKLIDLMVKNTWCKIILVLHENVSISTKIYKNKRPNVGA